MNIFVIGTGYVGLVQAAGLAQLGHNVVGIDIDEAKVEMLNSGEIPFFEPQLPELVQKGLDEGRLKFTSDYDEAGINGVPDVVFICVQTPKTHEGEADLRFVESAIKDVVRVSSDDTVLVIKSTIPPGSLEGLEKISPKLAPFSVNPEFLRQGKSVNDFFNPDRIVIGTDNDAEILESIYQTVDAPVIITNPVTAQIIKYAANSMLALRLSFMNELANISELLGGHIKDVEDALALDPRIGSKFLRSSAGFGGSCFPKDVLALHYAGEKAGYTSKLIAPIIEVNNAQSKHFVDIAENHIGTLAGKNIAVLGLAFNAGTDDTRESPAIRIVKELINRGAKIKAFDPQAMDNAKSELAEFGEKITYVNSESETLESADLLFVLTEWPEFTQMNWAEVKTQLKDKTIFDAKHFLPYDAIKAEGLDVFGIGL